ncbi:MAG: HEAT repeat domain-containing protein [Candidatus Hodarchaeales archaeon]|jgi:hypothetical protein
MFELPDIDTIHEALLQTIKEDPDLQVKNLIVSHLIQRNSYPLKQKLVALSKSPHPEVREIIAISLEGHYEVLDDVLDWFEAEKDLGILDKLFTTLSSTLNTVCSYSTKKIC